MHQFSFDLGTNSIGWAVLGLDDHAEPNRIIASGVRIFSDGREPKSGASLAEGRRMARGLSRRRDRHKSRRKALLRVLAEYGLMPDTREARAVLVNETRDRKSGPPQDVYGLRARALQQELPLHHIGRALFHLNQRRGFKSNRKTDARDNDQGKIATAIADLRQKLNGRTIGQFLFEERGDDPHDRGQVRVRPRSRLNDNGREIEDYAYYPQRAMLEEEFDAIWDAQAAFHPETLTDQRRAHLFKVIFYQRPLKRPRIGKCAFNPKEERLPRAHPLFQRFRLYKEINELGLVLPNLAKRSLTLDERDALVTQLKTQREAAFSALRKTIKPPVGARFNKEGDSRSKLKGDEVAAEMSHKSRFGQAWYAFGLEKQWVIIEKLRDTEDPLELNAWLETEFGFDPERRDAVAAARLPEGYGRLGITALSAMLDEMEQAVIPEADAARNVGYDHALARKGGGLSNLPNYQEVLERRIPPGSGEPDDPYDIRMGRITNPSVHIALNQLRRVTNALLKKHGRPQHIAIELARDLKLSEKQKTEVNRTIAQNTRDAERRGTEIEALGHANNGYNRALLRFWEELGDQVLNRVCVYCGQAIGVEKLFSGSVDIDHILPWSKTLDDSRANRILVHTACNRLKGNRAPADVPEWQADYDQIIERASRLPLQKRWRFAADAMEKYEGERDFLARQLTDTQYLSRMAHEYLAALYPDEEPDEWGVFKRKNRVRVIPGRLTEMLRRTWGLNALLSDRDLKNRSDHRHHAIDAIVVGVTTRAMLHKISTEAARGVAIGEEDALRRFAPPWKTFREDVAAVVEAIIVSHKQDHGSLPSRANPGATAGQLHNDTAYGLTGETRNGVPIVVRRKPLLALDPKDLPSIRDDQLRDRLETETYGLTGKDFTEALKRIQTRDPRYKGLRRVRVTEALNVIPIHDEHGRAYKAYKGDANYRYDVWELPDGKWVHEVVTMFDAHRPDWTSAIHAQNPAARKVLTLKQNDMVAYLHPDHGLTFGRVVKFSQGGQMTFAAHNEAGALKTRDADKADPFKYFYKSAGAMRDVHVRQVRIDEIGQVFDPGPQDRASRSARKAAS